MREQNRNLAIRVVTALLLFPFAVWMTWLGEQWFALLVALVAALCAGELVWMFEKRLSPTGWLGVLGAAAFPVASWLWTDGGRRFQDWSGVAGAGMVVALLATAMLQQGELPQAPRSAGLAALAWGYAGLLPASVVALRERAGWQWVVLLFIVTWANDTLAYFTGRFLGKRPLAPRISPKKTWEGFWGGAAGSVIGALVVKALFLPGLSPAAAALVGAGGAILGPLGDLAESMLKRAAGVKDSSRLVPGHGGLLDRIDAVLFVAPWVVACAMWFQR
ncbi:MAG TPA: phosphatidate cytidylyltransferase [Anaeromyxobacteraceae bacterium]|nr:phosphatidate cytidylyltransferase [Anaeromyxobacteraceae bacterium]